MESTDGYRPVTLPLRIDRHFRPWRYQVSHRTLELRSEVRDATPKVLDVVFVNVLAMKIRHDYGKLVISEAEDLDEAADFVEVPEQFRHNYRTYQVSDGTHSGFVICGSLQLRHEPIS